MDKSCKYNVKTRCSQYEKKKPSTKIERETKMKSPRENSTFGFLPTRKKANPKKPKELFFANDRLNNKYLAVFEL